MTGYSLAPNNLKFGMIPQAKPLMRYIMSLIIKTLIAIACFITSRKMDIDLHDDYKDSREYFSCIWNEDIEYINGNREKLKFSLFLIYEAMSLNIEFFWLRKTKIGQLVSKLINRNTCSGCY